MEAGALASPVDAPEPANPRARRRHQQLLQRWKQVCLWRTLRRYFGAMQQRLQTLQASAEAAGGGLEALAAAAERSALQATLLHLRADIRAHLEAPPNDDALMDRWDELGSIEDTD